MLRRNNFRKFIFVCFLIPLLLFVSCPEAEENNNKNKPEAISDSTSLKYFLDNDIRVGINIGNTLDASSETAWGNPKINQALLDGIKAEGFSIVRIPVTWKTHIGKAPDYKIDEKWMERVVEVADIANKAGIKAVIINLHHDGSTDSATSESGWLSINKSLADPAQKQEITTKFTKVWEQIATRFKDHGEWLIFEAFNEIHDGGWFWAGRTVPQDQYDIINGWAQVFTDTVRATGGNNAKRYLVIPSYCTGMEALLTNNFKLPTDSVEGKQIVAFHYYRPDGFSLNGKDETWDSSGTRTEINTNFTKLREKFIDNNIQVIIGETGPVLSVRAEGASRDTADANRITYINFFFGKARENNLIPVYWDNGKFTRTAGSNGNGDSFGIFNRNTGKPYDTGMAAVIQAMADAVKDAVQD
jgi:endoglucanase